MLAYLAELFVEFHNFICDLRSSHHWSLPHFLQHRFAQEYQFFVFFVLIVTFIAFVALVFGV